MTVRLLATRFVLAAFGLCLAALPLKAQTPYEEHQPPNGDGIYVSSGLGFLSLDRGSGFNVPMGITAVSSRLHLIASLNLLDLGLLQEPDPESRYTRYIDSFGQSICVDTETNFRASSFNCSGSTEFVRSASADIGFVPIQTDFFGGKQSMIFGGAGFRLRRPRTAYGTLGMLFPTYSGTIAGFKIMAGKDFALVQITWGINVRRILSRD
jgi:hypothetical protein